MLLYFCLIHCANGVTMPQSLPFMPIVSMRLVSLGRLLFSICAHDYNTPGFFCKALLLHFRRVNYMTLSSVSSGGNWDASVIELPPDDNVIKPAVQPSRFILGIRNQICVIVIPKER